MTDTPAQPDTLTHKALELLAAPAPLPPKADDTLPPNRSRRSPLKALNKRKYAERRLQEAPTMTNARLLDEIREKFGSAIAPNDIKDIRDALGLPARRPGRPDERLAAALGHRAAPVRVDNGWSKDAPEPESEDRPEPDPTEPLPSLLRQVAQCMVDEGIDRITLHKDGRWERHVLRYESGKLDL